MGSFEPWNLTLVDFITMMDREPGEGKSNPLASRHLLKNAVQSFIYTLCKQACSARVFFGQAKVFARESAMLKLQNRGGNGASPNLPLS